MRRHSRAPIVVVAAVLLVPLVAWGCGKAIGDTLNDATITTRVKTALLNDPEVGVLRIDVDTTSGVVTLSGAVPSSAQADRAVRIAKTVEGVKDVKSALKVMATGPASERLHPAF